MTLRQKLELKELLREVVKEELDARGITATVPLSSKRVMELTGWSYSKLKKMKAPLGAWKSPTGELMFSQKAVIDFMQTPRIETR